MDSVLYNFISDRIYRIIQDFIFLFVNFQTKLTNPNQPGAEKYTLKPLPKLFSIE